MDKSLKYKHLEDQIAVIKGELARKSNEFKQFRSSFFANISHEIRTPMNAIVGFSNLLSDPSYNQQQKTFFIQEINKSSKELLEIIDSIILTAEIENKNLNIDIKKTSALKVIQTVEKQLQMDAIKSGKKLELNFNSSEINTDLETDLKILVKAIINIIHYSSTISRNKVVEIGYNLFNDNKIEFYINLKNSEKYSLTAKSNDIDQKSYNYDEDNDYNIGLTIADKLIQLLGGKLKIKTDFDFESSFYFAIPLLVKKPVNKLAGKF